MWLIILCDKCGPCSENDITMHLLGSLKFCYNDLFHIHCCIMYFNLWNLWKHSTISMKQDEIINVSIDVMQCTLYCTMTIILISVSEVQIKMSSSSFQTILMNVLNVNFEVSSSCPVTFKPCLISSFSFSSKSSTAMKSHCCL